MRVCTYVCAHTHTFTLSTIALKKEGHFITQNVKAYLKVRKIPLNAINLVLWKTHSILRLFSFHRALVNAWPTWVGNPWSMAQCFTQLQSRNGEGCAIIIKTLLPGLPEDGASISWSQPFSSRWLVPCSTLLFVIYRDCEIMWNVQMLMSWRQWISLPRWSFDLFMPLKFSHLFLWNRTKSVCSQNKSPDKTFRIRFTAESMKWW